MESHNLNSLKNQRTEFEAPQKILRWELLLLSCVSPKFKCWSPNPQYFGMWPYLQIGSLQVHLVKMKSYWRRVGPNLIGLVSIQKGETWTQTHTGRVTREHWKVTARTNFQIFLSIKKILKRKGNILHRERNILNKTKCTVNITLK